MSAIMNTAMIEAKACLLGRTRNMMRVGMSKVPRTRKAAIAFAHLVTRLADRFTTRGSSDFLTSALLLKNFFRQDQSFAQLPRESDKHTMMGDSGLLVRHDSIMSSIRLLCVWLDCEPLLAVTKSSARSINERSFRKRGPLSHIQL